MVASQLAYLPFIFAQFHPIFATLIPGAIIVGLAAAPLWSACSTYQTEAASKYAELVKEDKDVMIARFFGLFGFGYQTHQIIGNIISSKGRRIN